MNKALIIIGTIIFLMLIFSSIKNQHHKTKLRKLNESRPNLIRSDYIDQLIKKGFNKDHVEVVHDKIRKFIRMKNFSMYPEDDIHKIYAIDDLDDIELMDEICETLNLRKVEQKDIDALNKKMKKFNAAYILTLTKSLAK